jgi:hypothetical protein
MLRIAGTAPERAPEVEVDPCIALKMRWSAAPRSASLLWWRIVDGPAAMLETGFHAESGELVDVTLVLPGPIARLDGPPPMAPSASPGIPCCDPAEWARRAPRGAVREFEDHYATDPQPLRTELGPDHLLVRIGQGDEPAARELSRGRARFGISAADALLWICVAGFSADERALLDEHADRSLRPPVAMQPAPPPAPARGLPGWLGGGRRRDRVVPGAPGGRDLQLSIELRPVLEFRYQMRYRSIVLEMKSVPRIAHG